MSDSTSRWRSNGVRVVRRGDLDSNTPQTLGMQRRAAVTSERTGATKLWAGTVAIDANAKTAPAEVISQIKTVLAAIADTVRFVRTQSRPWIDSGQDHAWEDPYTIAAVGDLFLRLHAAEAILEQAGYAVDRAIAEANEQTVGEASLKVAEAKVLTTEIAILAGNKLHELAGTRSTLAQHGLDRHWRNARTHTLHDPVRWKYALIGNHALNGVLPPRHAWV